MTHNSCNIVTLHYIYIIYLLFLCGFMNPNLTSVLEVDFKSNLQDTSKRHIYLHEGTSSRLRRHLACLTTRGDTYSHITVVPYESNKRLQPFHGVIHCK